MSPGANHVSLQRAQRSINATDPTQQTPLLVSSSSSGREAPNSGLALQGASTRGGTPAKRSRGAPAEYARTLELAIGTRPLGLSSSRQHA